AAAVLDVGEDVPAGPRVVVVVARVDAQRRVPQVQQTLVERWVRSPAGALPRERPGILRLERIPALLAIRERDVGATPHEEAEPRLTSASGGGVAGVTTHDASR